MCSFRGLTGIAPAAVEAAGDARLVGDDGRDEGELALLRRGLPAPDIPRLEICNTNTDRVGHWSHRYRGKPSISVHQ